MGWLFDAALMLGEAYVMGTAEEQISLKKISICRNCHAEGQSSDVFCKICGSNEMVRKDKFLKQIESKEEAGRVLEKELNRMSIVFEELHALGKKKICQTCRSDFPEEDGYCSKCGTALVPIQREVCEALILRKHPWIAQSPDELRRLKQVWEERLSEQQRVSSQRQQRDSDQLRSLSKKAAKASLKGIGKSLRMLGKAIDDASS